MSLTTLGVSAGGLVAYGNSPGVIDTCTLLLALSAFVLICSVEAWMAS